MNPRTWLPDPSHYPEQMTPLSASVWFEAVGRGLHEAMREHRGPFAGFEARTEMGWAYEGELPIEWKPDEEGLNAAALDLPRRWAEDLAPRAHAITQELHGMRPEIPDPSAAVALLDHMWHLVLEQWRIHFLAVIPAQVAAEILHDRYVAALGDADPLAPYRLLDGPNETTEADALLWSLAARARELRIDDVLIEYPPDLVLERLRELGHGRRFLQDLDAYLIRFGGRSRWHELSLPRESEQPVMTLEGVRLFLESGSPAPVHRSDGELEQRVLAEAPELGEVLATARAGYALKESHVYHIDYPGLLATREVLIGFGRRLAAEGLLVSVDDVWMLSREELREALASDLAVGALSRLVDERRAELERGRIEGPRPYLGEPPAEAERHAALEKFYGRGGREAAGRKLSGVAASPGVGEGMARVVAGPGDFHGVRPGDVMVATTTTPAWTPLFPSLGGLVTETGGILSHGAIVAREYGLPAVVGVTGATRSLGGGVRVRVDGTAGFVELL